MVCRDGEYRLASNKGTTNAGRVEIWLQGHWNTICDKGTTRATAEVLCKKLNFSDYKPVTEDAYYGEGYGYIALQHLKCVGSEKCLMECPRGAGYNLFNDSRCHHDDDFGVSCKCTLVPLQGYVNAYNVYERGSYRI